VTNRNPDIFSEDHPGLFFIICPDTGYNRTAVHSAFVTLCKLLLMKVGLFIPCYIDQFYPRVAIATLELLEKNGCEVVFPPNQTCCGQPMANAGFSSYTEGCNKNFISCFSEFDYIVSPSGSCVLHIKEHLHELTDAKKTEEIRKKIRKTN
jgi:Fe-S oxidoreductase